MRHTPRLTNKTIVLAVATRKAIADLGKSSYIAVSTGFWYEWILSIPAGSGIDFAKRTVTFFDEGETKISTSTLPQVKTPTNGSSKQHFLNKAN